MNAFDSKVLECVIAFVGHGEVREHYATKTTLAPFKVKLRIPYSHAFEVSG
jgi:hypothetical protein